MTMWLIYLTNTIMSNYIITTSWLDKTVTNTIIFHIANTQEELLNSFSDFYQKWNPDQWKEFVWPHIEMEIHDWDFVRYHNSENQPKLHIYNTENNNHPHTLCFTIPIPNEEEAHKKLKSRAMGSLYTLLHNEDFGRKYDEYNENDEQFADIMEKEFGISYTVEKLS